MKKEKIEQLIENLQEKLEEEIPLLVKSEVSKTLKVIDFSQFKLELENLHIAFKNYRSTEKSLKSDYLNMDKKVDGIEEMVGDIHSMIVTSKDWEHPSIIEKQNALDKWQEHHMEDHKELKTEKSHIITTSISIIGILCAALTGFLIVHFSKPNIQAEDLKPAIKEVIVEISKEVQND